MQKFLRFILECWAVFANTLQVAGYFNWTVAGFMTFAAAIAGYSAQVPWFWVLLGASVMFAATMYGVSKLRSTSVDVLTVELEKQRRLQDKQDLRREELRVQALTNKASSEEKERFQNEVDWPTPNHPHSKPLAFVSKDETHLFSYTEKQALGQVHEYLGKDADVESLPFRVVGAVTTTSTAAIDLFRVSPVNSISPMTSFFVVGHFTKTNSDGISLGLKLNKILIGPTHIMTEQKTGIVTWFIGTERVSLKWKSRNQSYQTDLSDERPVAPIHDIAFQGSADSGTLSIDEAWIYTLPIKD